MTGKTKGLLGFWNDNTNEEYLLPNGDFFSTASTMSQVHHSFGQQCKPFCYDNFCRIKGDATSEGKWKTKTWCQTLENFKVKKFKGFRPSPERRASLRYNRKINFVIDSGSLTFANSFDKPIFEFYSTGYRLYEPRYLNDGSDFSHEQQAKIYRL